MEEFFKSKNIYPKIKYELNTFDSVLSYVKSGLRVAVVLEDAIAGDDIDTIPLKDCYFHNIRYAYLI